MYKIVNIAVITFQLLCLAACGKADSNKSQTHEPEVEALATVGFQVSGTVSVAAGVSTDSDINDPHAAYIFNNTFETAQVIPSRGQLNGLLIKGGTRVAGDRFADKPDEVDVFSVTLQAGQYVSLAFYSDVNSADLDMYLYDASSALVQKSEALTGPESLQVPVSGDYFLVLYAADSTIPSMPDYAAKYILTINGGTVTQTNAAINTVDFVVDQALIKFHDQPANNKARSKVASTFSLTHAGQKRSALAQFNLSNMQSRSRLGLYGGSNDFETSLATANLESFRKWQTLQLIKKLNQRDDVEYAEPNYRRYRQIIPNDPGLHSQWHIPQLNLPAAWDLTTGTATHGQDIVVAVIDSGVYTQHEDLVGQLVPGYDFISNVHNALDGDGYDDDPSDPGDTLYFGKSTWHGTHVAGLIAAKTNNQLGLAGVSWGAKIMPLRVLGGGPGTVYDINQAVRFAAGLENDSGTVPAHRADIINLSLGGGGYAASSQALYNDVRRQGIIVVAAAGNEASPIPAYPASYEGVISVSAVDMSGGIAPYSNYGVGIDITAPGGDLRQDVNSDGYGDGVLSLLVSETDGQQASSYGHYQGTSMAAPQVSGVIALMKAVNPWLRAIELEALLVTGKMTHDIGDTGRDDHFGYGLLDALMAVEAADRLLTGEEQAAIIVTSLNHVHIHEYQTAVTLDISKTGVGHLTLADISHGVSWLDIQPLTVDADGFGRYEITVNRNTLAAGSYNARLTLTTDTAVIRHVNVTMVVAGGSSERGGVSHLWVLLLDATMEKTVAQVSVDSEAAGHNFTFESVAPGQYYLLVGSDIDNDHRVCGHGESCGGYPVYSQLEVLDVNADIAGLQLTSAFTSFLQGFSSSVERSYKRLFANN